MSAGAIRGAWVGRALGALGTLGIVAALLAAPSPAPASAPAPPPGCTGNSFSFVNSTPAPISGGVGADPVTSTIQVTGVQSYLRDLDLVTDISHTHSSDLDVTLTSPAGTVVTITTDNGSTSDNVFGNGTTGTRWDDDAATPVSDATLVNNVPSPTLIPEEAMAAFAGENPNGTWTLSIADDAGPDNGQLNSWSLDLATLEGNPTVATTSVTGAGTGAIPNPGSITGTAAIAGAGTYLSEVTIVSDIDHLASGDLNISLRSPSLTTTAISSNNGESFDNIFGDGAGGAAGTNWFDQAGVSPAFPGGGPVTDAEFQDNVIETPLVPEGALGAFIGENPNGTWNLGITDLFVSMIVPPPPDGGDLNDWSLSVETISGCTPTGGNIPPIANAGGPYTVAEGGSLNLNGSGSSDPDMDPLTYSWDVNGDGTFGDATGQAPTVSWDQLKALGVDDGPATYTVDLLVSDGEASDEADPAAPNLTLNNAPPALAITGPSTATATQSQTWTFSSTDPSPDDQAGSFTYKIDWDGEGAVDQVVTGDASIDLAHTYGAAASLTIKATSTDQDGGESSQASKAVSVGSPGSSGTRGAVACSNLIGGTRGPDRLAGTEGSDRITGRAGRDRIKGRGGDDCLKGGRGRDLIKGGTGDDTVRALGAGVDLVICGPGRDTAIASINDRLRGCEATRIRR